jgi:hypothetical protein
MSKHPEGEANPAVRFEREDIRATPVLNFLVGIAVTTVVVCFLLFGFYRGMRSFIAARQPPPPHMQFEASREPPAPRLQEHSSHDMAAMRSEEEQTLGGYGWVDRPGGVVRIPIEEAMKQLVQRGLPKTAAPPLPKQPPEDTAR